jgi:hypothetical protein
VKEDILSEIARPSLVPPMPKQAIEPRASFLLMFWLSVAVLLTLTRHLAVLGHQFNYTHDWVSAHFSTIARSFVEHGVIALGGVPIQNNSPLGLEPDVYLHWPPLFPITLSLAFRIFGESEATAHGLMFVILAANSLMLFALVRACCGSRAGVFAVFSSLVTPVTAIYGNLVSALHMAILGMLLALLGFIKATRGTRLHRGWVAFGALSLGLAVLASWEPLLACPGLLVVAIWRRCRSQICLALLYFGIGAVTVISVMTIYLLNSPNFFNDLWRTLLFQAGLVPFDAEAYHIHTIINHQEYLMHQPPPLVELLGRFAHRLQTNIGPLAIIAVGWVLITGWLRRHSSSDGSLALLFGGLIAPWLLWFVIMANHAYVHEYEILLVAPAASAALGVSTMTLIDLADAAVKDGKIEESIPEAMRWVALIVLPMVMLLPLIQGVKNQLKDPGSEIWMLAYASDVKAGTDPGAVVMMPYHSMVPVYYSKRHMIRGVANDSIVEKMVERLGQVFPGSRVYLALHPTAIQEFSQSLRRYQLIKQSKNLILLAVPASRTSITGS